MPRKLVCVFCSNWIERARHLRSTNFSNCSIPNSAERRERQDSRQCSNELERIKNCSGIPLLGLTPWVAKNPNQFLMHSSHGRGAAANIFSCPSCTVFSGGVKSRLGGTLCRLTFWYSSQVSPAYVQAQSGPPVGRCETFTLNMRSRKGMS